MLKFTNYIKESNDLFDYKFKKGDIVLFNYDINERIFNDDESVDIEKLNGQFGEIIMAVDDTDHNKIFQPKKYHVKFEEINDKILAYDTELTLKNENNTNKPNSDIIPNGSRVIVKGKQGRITYTGQKGKIIKLGGNNDYLIEFDDDDSKNRSSYTSLINRDLVTLSNEPSVKTIQVYKKGDKVKCIDKKSLYNDEYGIVDNYWSDDGSCMVKFGSVTMWMKQEQISLIEDNTRKIGFKISDNTTNTTNTTNTNNTNTNTNINVYEEEDDDDNSTNSSTTFKKEDLIEFSYKDFLLEDKISSLDDLLILKSKYEKQFSDNNISKIKKLYVEKTIKTIEIIESYYNFLINKISKDLPVFRTVEQIENIDLLKTKTKVRASESKELTRKYSFDQGIIVYWKFKDALIFKTL